MGDYQKEFADFLDVRLRLESGLGVKLLGGLRGIANPPALLCINHTPNSPQVQ